MSHSWKQAGGDPLVYSRLLSLTRVHAVVRPSGRCLAAVHPSAPSTGTLSHWTGCPEALNEATHWLKSTGCLTVVGPMEGCSWFNYRSPLGPHTSPAFLLEPESPPKPWIEAGFLPVAHYRSVLAPNAKHIERGERPGQHLSRSGWRLIAPLESPHKRDAFHSAVDEIHRLSHLTFKDAAYFCPIPLSQLRDLYRPMLPLIHPKLLLFAVDPSGSVCGFVFGLPDLKNPGLHRLIIKSLAVLPRCQRAGVGWWLVSELHRRAEQLGHTSCVHALMSERSHSVNYGQSDTTLLRRYAVFGRRLQ